MTKAPRPPTGPSTHRLALMLAQVGALAANRFVKRIAELDLSPAHANVLRVIATEPGRSHQSLSSTMGLVPARLAVILDELEQRGLIERRRHEQDQRLVALFLTPTGQQFMGQLAAAGAEHEREITGSLNEEERRTLGGILEKIAQAHGMTTGPGFSYLGASRSNLAGSAEHSPHR